VKGIYESLFSKLGGDATLQTSLSGTAGDKKIYPITATVRTALPAIKISVESGTSDAAFGINRPKNFLGSGITVHFVKKVAERDEYDEATLEYRRRLRYKLIVV